MTEKQFKLFKFIRNFLVHSNRGPSFQEMKEHMLVTSNQTINDWLEILERDNYIYRQKGERFGIKLGEKGKSDANMIKFEAEPPRPKSVFVPASPTSSNVSIFNVSITKQTQDGVSLDVENINSILQKGGENNGTS